MKAVQLTIAIIIVAGAIIWIRQGSTYSIVQTLPFLGGHKSPLYEAAALCLLLLTCWGLARLNANDRRRDQQPQQRPAISSEAEDDLPTD